MSFFDEAFNRFNRAKREADALVAGKDPKAEEKARREALAQPQSKVALLAKRYTVYRRLAGNEVPIAWGMSEQEAREFAACARRRMVKAHRPNTEGDPYFEATTFRIGEEL